MPDVALSTGGAVLSGGVPGSGGGIGTGGLAGLGGTVGTGGTVSTGGRSVATGGTSTGGASGGAGGAGGMTIASTGGATSVASGGARTGGSSGSAGAGGTTSAGSGGATTLDAGQASIYTGCRYIGGYNRAVVAKYDPQAGICVALVLVEPDRKDAGLGLSITENWGLAGIGLWPSTTSKCLSLDVGRATAATWAQGSVSVSFSPPIIDVDAVLSFPASDAGPAQSVELKAEGVDINNSCF